MVKAISGRIDIEGGKRRALGNCNVELYFTLPGSDGVKPGTHENPGATLARNFRFSGRTEPDGTFTITFPADLNAEDDLPLRFTVSAPAGQKIGEHSLHLIEALKKELVIFVTGGDWMSPIVLDNGGEPVPPPTRRVNGMVIDIAGNPVPPSLQVLLFARTAKEDGGQPVLVARTDRSGYFFGSVPNRAFETAAARISGIAREIEIALEDGFIPPRVVLAAKFPEAESDDDKDCACGSIAYPRTPTHEDIANAPNGFSADLGTGGCMQFNVPNRAIEEFDFYSVVRTTEPAIVGFNFFEQPLQTLPGEGDDPKEGSPATGAAQAALNQAVADFAAAKHRAAETAAAAAAAQKTVQAFRILYGATVNDAVRNAISQHIDKRFETGWTVTGARDIIATILTPVVQPAGLSASEALALATQFAEAIAGITADRLDDFGVSTFPASYYLAMSILATGRDQAAAAYGVAQSLALEAAAALATANTRLQEAQAAYAASSAADTTHSNEQQKIEAYRRRKNEIKPAGRAALSAINPIDWDDTPTFYQAAEIAHGHLLHFKQVWYSDGYSLGDLLYSVPLAPGQKKLISVLDWERREDAQRSELAEASEGVQAVISRDRDLNEVVTGALSESSRGGSRATSAGVGIGTGAAGNGSYQGFNFGALLGVSGGYGEANSSAWQTSARNISSSSLQGLRDRTLQSASAVRGLRSSVVQGVSQGEAVRATTEVIANHNHCHAVTVQYFEVLRHLKLQQELVDVRECLFIPLPMSEFDLGKTLRWRQELGAYLQRADLAGAFDALRRVANRWSEVSTPLQSYADEGISSISGELLLSIFIPLPPFPERPRPNPEDTAAEQAQAMADAVNPTTGPLGILLAIATGGVSLIAGAATTAAINSTREAAKGARALADELYGADPQERYARFHHNIVPGVIAAFIDNLQLSAIVNGQEVALSGADFTLTSEYQPGIPLAVSLRANLGGRHRRGDISQLVIRSAVALPASIRAVVNSAVLRYRAASFEHTLVDDRRINDDIDPPLARASFTAGSTDPEIVVTATGNGAAIYTPTDTWEQRRPRTEDQRKAAELIDHLNDNLEYYHHAIWWAMDPNRRYMLLDGYIAPNSANRSIASVVENRLIGIVGNSLILPVAAGVHLDPRFAANGKGEHANLLEFYGTDATTPPTRISLPTRGVFAESVMGSCNACEEIDDNRFWRWEDSPIDEPPMIEPLSTNTRRAESPSVTPTPFPTPIVSIQNAPAAPDPAGVGAMLDALGRQSFTDITGLAGTQANTAAAYSKALDTAFKFGKEASVLAQQAALLGSKDKALGAIDKAEADGKIDADTAKELRTSALRKMIGDAPSSSDPAEVQKKIGVVSDAKKSEAITEDEARKHTNSLLGQFYGTGGDDNNPVARAITNASMDDVQMIDASLPDGSSLRVEQIGYGGKIAPAPKTGLSNLGKNDGSSSSLVNRLMDGSTQWIDAVGKGLSEWKSDPSAELSDALGQALLEAATEAADKATDEIPFVKALKIAAVYSQAFAEGVGQQLAIVNQQLTLDYDKIIARDSGSNGYTDEDIAALRNIRGYQWNSVLMSRRILRAGLDSMTDLAIRNLGNWAMDSVAGKFSGASVDLLAHVLDRSPISAMIAGLVNAAGQEVPEARQKLYRSTLGLVISLFVKQLEKPALRSSLGGLTKLGGKEPMGKAILIALSTMIVKSTGQQPALRAFIDDLDDTARDGILQILHDMADQLMAAGVEVVGAATAQLPRIKSGDDDVIELPLSLEREISEGRLAASENDYRQWITDPDDLIKELITAAELQIEMLTRTRQRKLVKLSQIDTDNEAADRYLTEYYRYDTEVTNICRAVRQALIDAGLNIDSIFTQATAIRVYEVSAGDPRIIKSRIYYIGENRLYGDAT